LLGWAAFACWRYHSYMPSPFIGSTSNSLNAQNKASTPVRRIPHCDPIDVRGKICHLVFEWREGANVIGAALLVGMIKLLIRARRFNAALAGGRRRRDALFAERYRKADGKVATAGSRIEANDRQLVGGRGDPTGRNARSWPVRRDRGECGDEAFLWRVRDTAAVALRAASGRIPR